MVVGEDLVYCKIVYKDFFIYQKVIELNVPYSHRKLGNQTAPNSDNLGESYGCLTPNLLVRVG